MINHSALETQYNIMVNNINEIILFFQENGRIVDCNKAAKDLLNYGDDILNMYISDIFKDAVTLQDNCIVIDSKYNNISNETDAYTNNKTSICVELKIIFNRVQKNFIGLCVAYDITFQKKLISKLKHIRSKMKTLLNMKNRAVENIVHELRTPISGIMGMSELLMDMRIDKDQKAYISIIYQCCKRMNTIINDLFDVSILRNKRLILQEEEFNFRLMIDNVIVFYRNNISEKNLKLTISISEDIPVYLIGDEIRLAQIIDNLLSNAIKFTDAGEIILDVSMISQNSEGVELLFTVIDTGIGVINKDRNKIFMSFYQTDGSISRRYGGIGIGLSICKMLVRAMGGSISIEGTKDKGSIFAFNIYLKSTNLNNKDINDSLLSDNANIYTATTQEICDSNYDNHIEIIADGLFIIERLKIAISSENWRQAEQLASKLRDLILTEDKEITGKALQLLFSIRKEDREQSIDRIEDLKKWFIE